MNTNARSHIRVVYGYSQEFTVSIGVHHGSVLSSPLFIIMPEVFSRVLRSGGPLGYLCRSSCHHYWIDGGICQEAFDIEKAMEEMGLRVNAHDVQYRPGPPAEFREVLLRHNAGQEGRGEILLENSFLR